jgi:hypothetical protein
MGGRRKGRCTGVREHSIGLTSKTTADRKNSWFVETGELVLWPLVAVRHYALTVSRFTTNIRFANHIDAGVPLLTTNERKYYRSS